MASVNRIDSNYFLWLRVCLLYVGDNIPRAPRARGCPHVPFYEGTCQNLIWGTLATLEQLQSQITMVTELRIGSNFFLWHHVCLRSNSDFMTHVRHVHVGTSSFMKVDPNPALVVRPPGGNFSDKSSNSYDGVSFSMRLWRRLKLGFEEFLDFIAFGSCSKLNWMKIFRWIMDFLVFLLHCPCLNPFLVKNPPTNKATIA